MARPIRGFLDQVSDYAQGVSVRTSATIIAADPATLTDSFIAPTLAANFNRYDTVFLTAEIAGGSAPSVTVEPLFYDKEAADGSRWKRLAVGSAPGVTATAAASQSFTLTNGATLAEVQVFGHPQVFFRVSTVANATNTTGYTLVAMPGRLRAGFDKAR